jgi:hypothetical protein
MDLVVSVESFILRNLETYRNYSVSRRTVRRKSRASGEPPFVILRIRDPSLHRNRHPLLDEQEIIALRAGLSVYHSMPQDIRIYAKTC